MDAGGGPLSRIAFKSYISGFGEAHERIPDFFSCIRGNYHTCHKELRAALKDLSRRIDKAADLV